MKESVKIVHADHLPIHRAITIDTPNICPICKKKFYRTLGWIYKLPKRNRAAESEVYDYLCSYHCMRAAEKTRKISSRYRARCKVCGEPDYKGNMCDWYTEKYIGVCIRCQMMQLTEVQS